MNDSDFLNGQNAIDNNVVSFGAKTLKYVFNTGWLVLEKVLRLVAGLFIGAYVARYLGPTRYGLLNYAISAVSIITVICSVGLDAILVREFVKNKWEKNELIGTSLALRLIVVSFFYLATFIIVYGFEPDTQTRWIFYFLILTNFFEAFKVIEFYFQSQVMSRYIVWSQMIALITVSALRILLIYLNADVWWFAMTYTIDVMIVSLSLLLFYVGRKNSLKQWKFQKNVAMDLLSDSWPMIFVSISITLYMKIDQVMIKWMLGADATAYYSIAVRLSELWNFIPVVICSSVFPAIIKAKGISDEVYYGRLQLLFDLMVTISISAGIFVTIFSNTIVVVIFGNAYSKAAPILSLYIWSCLFTFLGVVSAKWVIAENEQRFRMLTLFSAALINIVLNYVLIQKIGLYGAAISTLVSYAIADYFSFLLKSKTRRIFYLMTRSLNLILLPCKMIKLVNYFSSKTK